MQSKFSTEAKDVNGTSLNALEMQPMGLLNKKIIKALESRRSAVRENFAARVFSLSLSYLLSLRYSLTLAIEIFFGFSA